MDGGEIGAVSARRIVPILEAFWPQFLLPLRRRGEGGGQRVGSRDNEVKNTRTMLKYHVMIVQYYSALCGTWIPLHLLDHVVRESRGHIHCSVLSADELRKSEMPVRGDRLPCRSFLFILPARS